MKLGVERDQRDHRGGDHLVHVARCQGRTQALLFVGRAQEQHAHRLGVHRGRAPFGHVVGGDQLFIADRIRLPAVLRASCLEESVERGFGNGIHVGAIPC